MFKNNIKRWCFKVTFGGKKMKINSVQDPKTSTGGLLPGSGELNERTVVVGAVGENRVVDNVFSNKDITKLIITPLINLAASADLRYINHCFSVAIGECIAEHIQGQYQVNNYPSLGFQIKFEGLVEECRQMMVLYCEAKKNLGHFASLAFVKRFEVCLGTFLSQCQDFGFNFQFYENYGEAGKVFIIKFSRSDFSVNVESFQVNIDCPFSAYFFIKFLDRYLSSNKWVAFINDFHSNKNISSVIDFLEKYKSFDGVTDIIARLICRFCMNLHPEAKRHSDTLLDLASIVRKNLMHSSLVKNTQLIEKTVPFFTHRDWFMKNNALLLVTELCRKGFLNKVHIKNLELIENTVKCFSDPSWEVQCSALALIAALGEQGLIEKDKIDDLLMKLLFRTFLGPENNHHKTWLIEYNILCFFVAGARLQLIDAVFVNELPLMKNLVTWLSHTRWKVQDKAISCLQILIEKKLYDSKQVKLSVLIEKTVKLFDHKVWEVQYKAISLFVCLTKEEGFVNLEQINDLGVVEKAIGLFGHDKWEVQSNAISVLQGLAGKDFFNSEWVKDLMLIEKIIEFFDAEKWEMKCSAMDLVLIFIKQELIGKGDVEGFGLIHKAVEYLSDTNWQIQNKAIDLLIVLVKQKFINRKEQVKRLELEDKLACFLRSSFDIDEIKSKAWNLMGMLLALR